MASASTSGPSPTGSPRDTSASRRSACGSRARAGRFRSSLHRVPAPRSKRGSRRERRDRRAAVTRRCSDGGHCGKTRVRRMAIENPRMDVSRPPPQTGQVVLSASESDLVPSSQVRTLYRLSDPALSELGLEDFLDELLVRVRDALAVDTVAILLRDED